MYQIGGWYCHYFGNLLYFGTYLLKKKNRIALDTCRYWRWFNILKHITWTIKAFNQWRSEFSLGLWETGTSSEPAPVEYWYGLGNWYWLGTCPFGLAILLSVCVTFIFKAFNLNTSCVAFIFKAFNLMICCRLVTINCLYKAFNLVLLLEFCFLWDCFLLWTSKLMMRIL